MQTGQILKTNELADLLEVSPRTINDWVQKGKLRSHRTPGGQLRFRTDQLWVEEAPEAPAPRPHLATAAPVPTPASEASPEAPVDSTDAQPDVNLDTPDEPVIGEYRFSVEIEFLNQVHDSQAFGALVLQVLSEGIAARDPKVNAFPELMISLRLDAEGEADARLRGMVLVKRATLRALDELGDSYRSILTSPAVAPVWANEGAVA